MQRRQPLLGVSAGETGQGNTRGRPSDANVLRASTNFFHIQSPEFSVRSPIAIPAHTSLSICICLRKPERSAHSGRDTRPLLVPRCGPLCPLHGRGRREHPPGAGGNISGRRNTGVGKDPRDGCGVPGALCEPRINSSAHAYFIVSHSLRNIKRRGKLSPGGWQGGGGTGTGRKPAGVPLQEELGPLARRRHPRSGSPRAVGPPPVPRGRGLATESEPLEGARVGEVRGRYPSSDAALIREARAGGRCWEAQGHRPQEALMPPQKPS